MQELKLEKFQGPLDLLVQLIDQENLPITEISLSAVTEQFFAYLHAIEEERPEELADFLVIATRLVYLKSRELLPYLHPEEEEGGVSLATMVKLYKRYVDASVGIEERWQAERTAYGRVEPIRVSPEFTLPHNADLAHLESSFRQLLKRLKPIRPLPVATLDKTASVKSRIAALRDLLQRVTHLRFSEMMGGSSNRGEVVVNFLALLELVREKLVYISQDQSFADMDIKKV